MDFETLVTKTPATLDEIRARVDYALDRHPLCRRVEFDIVTMPRTRKGNWTISLKSVAPDALWEASDIVADIQEAYESAPRPEFNHFGRFHAIWARRARSGTVKP